MILFMEDWAKYPSAVIHENTTNVSALKLADLYDRAGVENNSFFLSLFDKDLMHIDPFSLELNDLEKTKVFREAMINPWYFIRELARFPGQGLGKPIQFEMHRANVYYLWSFYNHIDTILIAVRQTGKSAIWEWLNIYLLWVAARNLDILSITNKPTTKANSMNKIKAQRDLLPSWLCMYDPKIDADNQSYFTCKFLNNNSTFKTFAPNEEGARSLGRGSSVSVANFDEFAVSKYSDLTIPAALSATDNKIRQAKEAGAVYGRTFTCTAGRRDTEHGAWGYNWLTNAAPFKDAYYDLKNNEELVEACIKNAPGGIARFGGVFNHRQMGRSDEWLRETIAKNGGTRHEILADYFNVWTNASAESPFSPELLEFISLQNSEPVYSQVTTEKYAVSWYIPEDQIEMEMDSYWHVLGFDSSESFNADGNGLTLTNVQTGEVIMTLSVSETDNALLARYIANFLIRFPKVLLMPERKSSFSTIMDIIFEILTSAGVNVFKRVFNKLIQNKDAYDDNIIKMIMSDRPVSRSFYHKHRKDFGFITTGSSRPVLYDQQLTQAVKTLGHVMKDKTLVAQLLVLEVRGGRVDHPPGGHDDQVVSWLLTYWLLRYGHNLSYYGMDRDSILTHIPPSTYKNRRNDAKEEEGLIKARYELAVAKEKMVKLQDDYTKAKSIGEQMRLEIVMKNLSDSLEEMDGQSLNIDSFIRDVKKQRLKKRRR